MKTNTFVNSGFQKFPNFFDKFDCLKLLDKANLSCRGNLSIEQTRNDLDKKGKPVRTGNILNKTE